LRSVIDGLKSRVRWWAHDHGMRMENVWLWLAGRLPRKLAYWSFIRQGVRHIHDDEWCPK
jgi:hypothetical protein